MESRLFARFPPFSQCSASVDKSTWLASCLESACSCLQEGAEAGECKCRALEDYVAQCKRARPEVHLQDWRTLHLCRESSLSLAPQPAQLLSVPTAWSTMTASTTPASLLALHSAPLDLAHLSRCFLLPHIILPREESASPAASVPVAWSGTVTPASSPRSAPTVCAGQPSSLLSHFTIPDKCRAWATPRLMVRIRGWSQAR